MADDQKFHIVRYLKSKSCLVYLNIDGQYRLVVGQINHYAFTGPSSMTAVKIASADIKYC